MFGRFLDIPLLRKDLQHQLQSQFITSDATLILKLKFLRKTNFSEYQEMATPTFLFIKGNYTFADQNFKPSLLINKTIVIRNGKKQFLSVSYDYDKTRNYREMEQLTMQ